MLQRKLCRPKQSLLTCNMKALMLRIFHTRIEAELTLVTGGTLQILVSLEYTSYVCFQVFLKFTPISLRPEEDFARLLSHRRRCFYLQKAEGKKECKVLNTERLVRRSIDLYS
jgi:hypothetical protein